MFVKITNGDGWYRGLEGEVFEVSGEIGESDDGHHYYAEPEDAHDTRGSRRIIGVDDCQAVSGPATKYLELYSNDVRDVEHTWYVGGVQPGESIGVLPGTYQDMRFTHADFSEATVEYSMEAEAEREPDLVNHPSHYTTGRFEVIEIIAEITKGYEDPFVAYCVGNAQKYIARAPHKGKLEEDLEKAAKYIEFALDHIRGES